MTVGSQIVKQLEDRGWIEVIGYRDAPGRPGLYATTRQFLDDLGVGSLDALPPIDALALGEARALEASHGGIAGAAVQAGLPLEALEAEADGPSDDPGADGDQIADADAGSEARSTEAFAAPLAIESTPQGGAGAAHLAPEPGSPADTTA